MLDFFCIRVLRNVTFAIFTLFFGCKSFILMLIRIILSLFPKGHLTVEYLPLPMFQSNMNHHVWLIITGNRPLNFIMFHGI